MRPYIINNEINGSISMMNKEMLQCVTFYDFETTGICDPGAVSLAIIRQEYGKVVFAKYYLINPEKEIEKNA